MEVGGSTSVSGGIPEIGTATESFNWKVSGSINTSSEVNTTTTITETVPVNVPSMSTVTGTFSWKEATLSQLPYHATFEMT